MHAAPSSRTAVAHRHSQTSGSPAACGAVGRPAGPVPRRHSAAAPGPSVVAAAGGKASGSGAKQPAAAAAKKATQWVPPNGILKINPELLATGAHVHAVVCVGLCGWLFHVVCCGEVRRRGK